MEKQKQPGQKDVPTTQEPNSRGNQAPKQDQIKKPQGGQTGTPGHRGGGDAGGGSR